MSSVSTAHVVTSEVRELSLTLGVRLFDQFTGANWLLGSPQVRIVGTDIAPFQREGEATFLFFDPLPPGAQTVSVRNGTDARTSFYVPRDIPITLPMPDPLWPVYPNDRRLADQTRPLDDPAQPIAYKRQRERATVQPSAAYPFPAGATLVRGSVRAAGAPLSDAIVTTRDAVPYVTGENGEFVLWLPRIGGSGATITVSATHPKHAPINVRVNVRRGTTVATTIAMA